MPSRRPRPARRRATVLHPTRPRPAARWQRSKFPTASKTSGIPQEFRDSGAHGHVLEHCALPGCTEPPRRRPLLLGRAPAQGLSEEETRLPRHGLTGAHRAASRRRAGAGGAGGLCRWVSADAGIGAGGHPLEGASYHRPPRRRGPIPTARTAEPPRGPVAIPSQNRRATRPVEGRGAEARRRTRELAARPLDGLVGDL